MELEAFLALHRIQADRVEHPAVMTVEESERLGFASTERLLKHLGVTPGSVNLLALRPGVRVASRVERLGEQLLLDAQFEAAAVAAGADMERHANLR